MSVKDYLKIINIQDLTTGSMIRSIPINHDKQITCTLSYYELEILSEVLEILHNEHNVVLKIGYKGESLL